MPSGTITAGEWPRIDAVVTMLLENDRYLNAKRSAEFTGMVMETFDIKKTRAQLYIREAKKLIRGLSEEERKRNYAKAMLDREFIIAKAKGGEKTDLKLTFEAIKDRDKLKGLYDEKAGSTENISLKKLDLTKLSDEQLTALEAIIKKGENPKQFLLSIGVNVD